MADTLLPQPTTNPVLSEIMGLSPQAKTALGMAGHTVQPPQAQADTPPTVAPIHMPGSGVPQLGAPTPPLVSPQQAGTIQGDTLTRQHLLQGGPPVDSIYHNISTSDFGQNHPFLGKLLGVAGEVGGKIGDTLANAVPGIGQQIPGTTLNHNLLLARNNSALAGDIGNAKSEAGIADTESQTGLRNAQAEYNAARPDIEQGKVDQKTQAAHGKLDEQYANIGYKPNTDPATKDASPYVPDESSPKYQSIQATNDFHKAQSDVAEARKDLLAAQKSNLPEQMQLAQGRLAVAQRNASTALGRLGLSSQEFSFNQDKTYNPEPTSKERSTGDLAQSAVNQVHTMRGIIKDHPDMFGPGGDAKQELQRWLSSDAKDAGKFLAARDYLAEHSAGVFGGRGQYIIKQLQDITNPNFNPSALNGALDQAEETANHFVKAGTTHGKGETGNAAAQTAHPGAPPAGATHIVPGSDGKNHYTDGKNDLGVAP